MGEQLGFSDMVRQACIATARVHNICVRTAIGARPRLHVNTDRHAEAQAQTPGIMLADAHTLAQMFPHGDKTSQTGNIAPLLCLSCVAFVVHSVAMVILLGSGSVCLFVARCSG